MSKSSNTNKPLGNLFASDIGSRQQASQSESADNEHFPPPLDTQTVAPPPRKVYSVSELNRAVGKQLNQAFSLVWLEGEISNLSTPSSGHVYFTLKDNTSQVRCALFRTQAARTNAQLLVIGANIVARAKVGLYEPRGEYQLVIQTVDDAGVGKLQLAYEQLFKKLQHEGLFDPQRKQAIPENIQRVGLTTSSTGAAVHDVISTIRRRNPSIKLLLYPSMVQGEAAPETIRAAINLATEHQQADVLLIVRGGGSAEDLWAFNDEQLARTIADCPIPTISGVGHEVDTTICDWVADIRAPTPTAAAELVAVDRQAQLAMLETLSQRLIRQQQYQLLQRRQQLQQWQQRLAVTDPERKLQQHSQRLDEMSQRLADHGTRRYQRCSARLQAINTRFGRLRLQTQLRQHKRQLHAYSKTLDRQLSHQLKQSRQQLGSNATQLHAISPLQTIARGYAIVKSPASQVVRQIVDAPIESQISIQVQDGHIEATVTAHRSD